MNKNPEDPRIVQSKTALRQAFLSLMEKKNFDKITITEIAERAGVARLTFYLHYETKEELLLDIFDDLFGKAYRDYYETWKKDQDDNLRVRRVAGAFKKYKEHASLIKAMAETGQLGVIEKNTEMIINNHLHNLMELYDTNIDPRLMKFAVQYFAGAFMTILIGWINSGMEAAPRVIAVIYTRLSGEIYDYLFLHDGLLEKFNKPN